MSSIDSSCGPMDLTLAMLFETAVTQPYSNQLLSTRLQSPLEKLWFSVLCICTFSKCLQDVVHYVIETLCFNLGDVLIGIPLVWRLKLVGDIGPYSGTFKFASLPRVFFFFLEGGVGGGGVVSGLDFVSM